MPDYEGMILAYQDARDIDEDNPDYDPGFTCWCCSGTVDKECCETCDYRLWKEFINGSK